MKEGINKQTVNKVYSVSKKKYGTTDVFTPLRANYEFRLCI